MDKILELLKGIDWAGIFDKIKKFITTTDWKKVGDTIKGIFDFIMGLIKK